MANYKASRNAEDVKREIASMVRELKDPRVDSLTLTVVRTEIAHDLSYCKIYISSLHGIEEAKTACDALNGNAKGFIRRELSSRLYLRKSPDLKFIPDDSIEKSIEMFNKLKG